MGKDYSKNPEKLDKMRKIVESGSPFQHLVVNQMAMSIREEANARDRGEYTPKQEKKKVQVRRGSFLLQTQKGRFLYASLGNSGNQIVLPLNMLFLSEFSQIVQKVLSEEYRPAEPEDYNYLWEGRQQVKPTLKLLMKEGSLTLISREPILSDVTYHGREKPHWGRVEITVTRSSGNAGMDTVTLSDEYIGYFFSDGLCVATNPYDLSWDGTPDKDKEPYFLRGEYGARAYAVVKNKEEMERLIPFFWHIIQRVIGQDKIIAISTEPSGWLPLTLEEAKRRYGNVRLVKGESHLIFEEDGQPKPWSYKGGGFPTYYFPVGKNEVGLLIDRSNSAYMIPYLFRKTRWFRNGIDIKDPEIAFERT